MRLTWKLSLAVGMGVLLVLAAHAALRVHRDVVRFREAVRTNHRTVGLLLAASIEEIAASEGALRARALVEEVNRRQPELAIAWVDLDAGSEAGSRRDGLDLPPRAGYVRSVSTSLPGDQDGLATYVTLQLPGAPVTAIEIVEPLTGEAEYAREAVLRTASTTFVVLTLCVSIILGFGVLFVGRPLEALRTHARRVGRGERGIETRVRSRDEIGELTREMNAMTAALDRARVRVRTEEAARLEALAQLRHADRLRAVGAMASSVAHDLGTPMGTVNARAQMIASGEVDADRARELAGMIVEEIERMSGSIRQLLDHGRRSETRRERTAVAEWVSSIADVMRPLAERRRVEIDVEIGTPDLVAELDANQMRHVLINLLSNAIDASPPGTAIAVRVERDGDQLRVLVSDHGPGVAADQLEAIFEPFFTTKAPGRGTGLGLSVARGIVEEHGGTLLAVRVAEGGARFEVRIPGVEPG